MAKLKVEDIKKLREETGAGVMEVKQTLEQCNGSYAEAFKILMEKVGAKAAKKSERVTKDGLVTSYIHAGGKIGSLISLACETDFVAKTEAFQNLAHEVALQACTEEFENVEALLTSEYIRDPSKKIQDLVNETIAKTGA